MISLRSLFTGVRGIGILRTSPFGDSRKFALTEFYEVRYALATPSNSKDTTFGGCAIPHNLGTLPPKSRQRRRTASRRRWAPRGVGSQWCNRLYRTSTSPKECRGVRSMVMRRLRALLATGVLVALVALALSSCGGGASGAGSSGGG